MQSLIIPWLPRVDGNFLTQNPQQLVAEGKIANVPFINGMLTLPIFRRKLKIVQVTVTMREHYFLFQLRISRMWIVNYHATCWHAIYSTSAELQTWIQTVWFPQAPSAAIEQILDLYTDDVALGSPFDTGAANNLTAQYKRIAVR